MLTELPGSVDQALLEKRLDPTTTVEVVNVGDAAGYWISGVVFRMESALDRAATIGLASHLAPL